MKKFLIEVSLEPQIHQGQMSHMWQIIMVTNDGKFTVAHGFEIDPFDAWEMAVNEAEARGLV